MLHTIVAIVDNIKKTECAKPLQELLPMTLLVLLAAAAWAWIVPPDFLANLHRLRFGLFGTLRALRLLFLIVMNRFTVPLESHPERRFMAEHHLLGTLYSRHPL